MSDLSQLTKCELMTKLHAAIDDEPEERRPVLRQIAFTLASIDRHLTTSSRLVRETNVIAARIIDRFERFHASGEFK